jgi:hypothetical protein
LGHEAHFLCSPSFPPDVIRHAVWLYLRFTLSYRDVEDLLAERGLNISDESIRRWVLLTQDAKPLYIGNKESSEAVDSAPASRPTVLKTRCGVLPRSAAELLKLGIDVAESTVSMLRATSISSTIRRLRVESGK